MQLRHRAPTIFSIYMVDVLCCALGCVVLMWQYNLNEAEERAASERAALENLAKTNFSLDSTTDAKKKLEALLADQLTRNGQLSTNNQNLAKELEEQKKQYLLLALDRDSARADIKNLILVHKKKLDDAMAAEALARKAGDDLANLLDGKQLEIKTLKKELEAKKAQYLLLAVERDNVRTDIKSLSLVHKKELEEARAAEALARKAGEELTKLLDALRIDYKNLTQTAGEFKKGKETSLAKLAENATIIAELSKKIQEAELQLAGLRKDVRQWKTAADAAGIKVGETRVTLQDALARNRKLETLLDQLQIDIKQGKVRGDLLDQENARIRAELASTRGELADSKKRLLLLTADFDTQSKLNQELSKRYQGLNVDLELQRSISNKDLKSLRLENLSLMQKLQLIDKNRFAGITLTGSRVIFMVDMSGSMIYVDEGTLDPDKWPTVCETVGKLMLSLPDLKQYQVILFANGMSFPLGKEGRWVEYEGRASVDATVKKLKSVKPAGGTNIYGAFAEVFKYREQGLDTVYFFSDGLPTLGEGLPADSKALNEQKKTEILGTHVRRTLKAVWNRPLLSSPRVRINTIGFFYESPDVGAFLWALARENDGSFVGMSKP